MDIPVLSKRPINSTSNSNRRSFGTNSSSSTGRGKACRSGGAWSSDPTETQIGATRNLEPHRSSNSNYNHYNYQDSKGPPSYNRFAKHALESASLLGNNSSSNSGPENSTSVSATSQPQQSTTRRFESRKFKNDRELDFATARQPLRATNTLNAASSSAAAVSYQGVGSKSSKRNLSEGSDDFHHMMDVPNSPTGSDVDDSMWLDVEPGADFEFQNDLEALKMDYNNEIDDLNSEQIENDLSVMSNRKENMPKQSQPEVNQIQTQKSVSAAPKSQQAQQEFNLNEFLDKNSGGKLSGNKQFSSGSTGGSRLQRLFNSASTEQQNHKNIGAEFDHYLQSFEFDTETNDLRFHPIHTEAPTPKPQQQVSNSNMSNSTPTLSNGMSFIADVSSATALNNPQQQNQKASRFAHMFVSDVNQNNLPIMSSRNNDGNSVELFRGDNSIEGESKGATRTLTVDTGEKIQILSLADIESDVSPVPSERSRDWQWAPIPHNVNAESNLSIQQQQQQRIISANELEKGLLATSPPNRDNDLSAFTSLLNQLGGSASNTQANMANNRMVSAQNQRPVHSPGPELIQDEKELNARRMTAAAAVTSSENVPRSGTVNQMPPMPGGNLANQKLFSEAAIQLQHNHEMNQKRPNDVQFGQKTPRSFQEEPNASVNRLGPRLVQTSAPSQSSAVNLPPGLQNFKQQLQMREQEHLPNIDPRQQPHMRSGPQQQQQQSTSAANNIGATVGTRRGPSDNFTPTVVMRNLSMDNPNSMASSQSNTTTNPNLDLLGASMFAGEVSGNRQSVSQQKPLFPGMLKGQTLNLTQQMDPRFQELVRNMNTQAFAKLVAGSSTTQALQNAQLSAAVQNAGQEGNGNGTSTVGVIGGSNVGSLTSSTAGGISSQSQAAGVMAPSSVTAPNVNVPTMVGPAAASAVAALVNPFLLNSMIRPNTAAPQLMLPGNPAAQLQNLLARQQLAAALLMQQRAHGPSMAFRPPVPNNTVPGAPLNPVVGGAPGPGMPGSASGAAANKGTNPLNAALSANLAAPSLLQSQHQLNTGANNRAASEQLLTALGLTSTAQQNLAAAHNGLNFGNVTTSNRGLTSPLFDPITGSSSARGNGSK
ncbi:uncharacterized protein LOC142339019 [Convolutriloba macropyga]|uniref:uncharacterized protein LOC142339019 n=1 Tax=Convolutriloba macropyga TaxID=536237 RepID=UPI003F51DD9E